MIQKDKGLLIDRLLSDIVTGHLLSQPQTLQSKSGVRPTFIFFIGEAPPNIDPGLPSKCSGRLSDPDIDIDADIAIAIGFGFGRESGLLAIMTAGDIGDDDDELWPLPRPLSTLLLEDLLVLLLFLTLFRLEKITGHQRFEQSQGKSPNEKSPSLKSPKEQSPTEKSPNKESPYSCKIL